MDGFINLHKEAGYSSYQAVAAIKRLLRCKTGHAGTLDPGATGVLPLCIGKGTRLAEYVTGRDKEYLTRIRFGITTDSYDAAGLVIAKKPAAHLQKKDIEALLPRFCGNIMQVPPVISAIKQGGVPLYKRARRGETPELKPRPVEIFSLQIKDCCFAVNQPYIDLHICCGKGVYVRSLAHDLGELLGTGAYVESLQRLRVGNFLLKDAYTLPQIEQMLAANDTSFVLPLNRGIEHLPQFIAPPQAIKSLLHGNSWPLTQAQAQPLLRVQTAGGQLLGLGNISQEEYGGFTLNMNKVLADITENYSVVAIGNFDGVHLGHQHLLHCMKNHQQRLGGKSAVLSFEPHPLSLLTGQTPSLLHTAAEKQQAILNNGVDALINLDFTEALRDSSPQQFVEDIISRFAVRRVVVGFNFHFGAGGKGDAFLLRQLCAAYDVQVDIVDAVSSPFGVVSSSNIRKHLQQGNMSAANHMLGYWYQMSGKVIMGRQIGRTLGFPTANFLPPPNKALPPCGVYAVKVLWQGKAYKGVANFGFKPTISGAETTPLMEAHLFDTEPQLYGEQITVCLGKFLRGEKTFANTRELATQIAEDSKAARIFLG